MGMVACQDFFQSIGAESILGKQKNTPANGGTVNCSVCVFYSFCTIPPVASGRADVFIFLLVNVLVPLVGSASLSA